MNFNKLASLILVGVEGALAQQAPPAPAIKPSPASDTLTQTAKQVATDKAELQNKYNQARSAMDSSAKQLQAEHDAAVKALREKLKADKKYTADVTRIDAIQSQMEGLNHTVQDHFMKEATPLQAKIADETAVVNGLVPVVRKESALDDTMTFDIDTQTWKTAATPTPKK